MININVKIVFVQKSRVLPLLKNAESDDNSRTYLWKIPSRNSIGCATVTIN